MDYDLFYENCIDVHMCFRRKDNDIILFWDKTEQFKNTKIEIYRVPYSFHAPEFWKLPEGAVRKIEPSWIIEKEDELYYCNSDEIPTTYNTPCVLENKLVLVGRLDSKIRLCDFKYMNPVCKIDIPTENFYANISVAPDTIYMLILTDAERKYTSLPYFISGWKKEHRDDDIDFDEI